MGIQLSGDIQVEMRTSTEDSALALGRLGSWRGSYTYRKLLDQTDFELACMPNL
jgi:hypothetical protein